MPRQQQRIEERHAAEAVPRRGQKELGVLFDAYGALNLIGFSATVFLANLYDLPATLVALLDGPKEVFDSSEELIAAGWRVD